jgi:polysaccharide export outer membrane protein
VFTTRCACLLACAAALLCAHAAGEDYRIGPDDVIEVIVWGEDELSKEYPVSSKGTIAMPIVGLIEVGGLTVEESADLVSETLRDGYIKEPRVTVLVAEYNSQKVLVFGSVERPNLYKLKRETTLLELLSEAGGVKGAAGGKVVITRTPQTPKAGEESPPPEAEYVTVSLDELLIEGDVSQNVSLLPGDTVYVSSSGERKVYVLGQVVNPGPYDLGAGATVLEILQAAGGVAEFGNANKIQVRRTVDGRASVITVSVTEISRGDRSQDIPLQPGDVVTVPRSWL